MEDEETRCAIYPDVEVRIGRTGMYAELPVRCSFRHTDSTDGEHLCSYPRLIGFADSYSGYPRCPMAGLWRAAREDPPKLPVSWDEVTLELDLDRAELGRALATSSGRRPDASPTTEGRPSASLGEAAITLQALRRDAFAASVRLPVPDIQKARWPTFALRTESGRHPIWGRDRSGVATALALNVPDWRDRTEWHDDPLAALKKLGRAHGLVLADWGLGRLFPLRERDGYGDWHAARFGPTAPRSATPSAAAAGEPPATHADDTEVSPKPARERATATADRGAHRADADQQGSVTRAVLARLGTGSQVTNVRAFGYLEQGARLAEEAGRAKRERDRRAKALGAAFEYVCAVEAALHARLARALPAEARREWLQRREADKTRASSADRSLDAFLRDGALPSMAMLSAWLRTKRPIEPIELRDLLREALGLDRDARKALGAIGSVRVVLAHRQEYESGDGDLGTAARFLTRSEDGDLEIDATRLRELEGACRQLLQRLPADLSGAHLAGVNLRGAALRGVDLSGANLEGADLRGADLRGANLRGCNLRRALLSEASLEWSDLDEADLRGADLRAARAVGARLRNAALPEASLRRTDLTSADLRSADLTSASLVIATLERACLDGARLVRTDLTGARMRDASLRETSFDGAILHKADLSRADLRRAHLSRAVMRSIDIREGSLRGADLHLAILNQARVTGETLVNCDLRVVHRGKAHEWVARRHEAETTADTRAPQLYGCVMFGARLDDADLSLADLDCADLRGADLTGAKLTDALAGCLEIDGTPCFVERLGQIESTLERIEHAAFLSSNGRLPDALVDLAHVAADPPLGPERAYVSELDVPIPSAAALPELARVASKRVHDASTHLERALKLVAVFELDQVHLHFLAGRAHELLGRSAEAIHHYESARRLAPDMTEALPERIESVRRHGGVRLSRLIDPPSPR